MAFIRWIIALPFIVGAVLFALANPETVSVTINPFVPPVKLPLYFIALLFLGIGFLLGAIIAWFGMSDVRKEKRAYKKDVKNLTKEIEELKEKNLKLEIDIEKQSLSHLPDIIDVSHEQ